MVHPVEELLQVDVHDPVATTRETLCLVHCLVGSAARPEAVAMLGEGSVLALLQDL